MTTICGIDRKLFANQPTPVELAAVVARWDSEDQAEFFIMLGEQLRNCCGGRVFTQWQYIIEALRAKEAELCDGSGSQLLKELADRLELSPA